MKVHYKGKLEALQPADQKKLDARFARLSKLLDRKSEKEAHVILDSEGRKKRAEITVNYYDHALCGEHTNLDTLSALTGALDKLEKQILKLQAKRREGRRGGKKPVAAAEAPAVPETPVTKIYRGKVARKPMTVDEAILELDGAKPYLAFRDSGSDKLSVLIRRADGHLDLVETD